MSRPAAPLVIAHRGASGYRPENTLPAFDLAARQRADMIEIDLHRTRDGVTVIRHDEELASLGGTGDIADATLAELRALDAGEGERIPTLDEVLDRFGAQIAFNLEFKWGRRGAYRGMEAAVLEAVERRGLLPRTLFSSFSDPILAALRAHSARARIGFLLSPRAASRPLERARAVGAEAIHPWIGLAQPELVAAAHAEGLAVYVFTVDAEEEMRRLFEIGVDGLFTNYPDRLRGLLDSPWGVELKSR
ncbi:MAG: glycerophosphodiester phosphodiesterase family protein [Myxococcota bacterium]